MKYKYEDVKSVEVKESFQVHKHNEHYEATETIDIPIGEKGVINSMGCSGSDNFGITYEIELNVKGKEIAVVIMEKHMERYFLLN